MTAPAIDVREHLAAIKAAVKAQFGPNNVYGYGEVPGSNGNPGAMPNIFALISVERRHVPITRLAALPSRSSWRVSVRWVGRTEPEARWAEHKATLALDGLRIVIDGETSTPLQHESSTAAQYDEGRMSGLTRFTYTC